MHQHTFKHFWQIPLGNITKEPVTHASANKREVNYRPLGPYTVRYTDIEVITFNAQSAPMERIRNIVLQMDLHGTHVAMIQSTLNDFEGTVMLGNYTCFSNAAMQATKGKQGGVIIIIHNSMCTNALIKTCVVQQSHIFSVRLKTKHMDVSFVTAYMPGEHWEATAKQESWKLLRAYLRQLPKRTTPIVGIDSNGHTGTSNPSPSLPYMGPKGHTKWTSNGISMLELLHGCGMTALNTLSSVHSSEWTWTSADKKSQTNIDFLLFPIAQQCNVKSNWGTWENHPFVRQGGVEDHLPVCALLRIPTPYKENHTPKVQRYKYDLQELKFDLQLTRDHQNAELMKNPPRLFAVPQRVRLLQQSIQESSNLLTPSMTTGEKIAHLQHAMDTALKQHYPLQPQIQKPRSPWMQEETWQLMLTKQEMWQQVLDAANNLPTGWEKQFRIHMQVCKKQKIDITPVLLNVELSEVAAPWHLYVRWHYKHVHVIHKIRQDKQKFHDSLLEQADRAADIHDTKTMWHFVHRLSKFRPKDTSALRHNSGEWCHGAQQELQAIQQYQMETLQMKSEPIETKVFPSERALQHTSAEAMLRLRSHNIHKAIPRWAHPTAAWQICEDTVSTILPGIWEQISLEGHPPEDWQHHETVWIPKPKQDATRVKNRRPINLTETLHRAYTSQLQTKIQSHMINKWRPTTFGALPKRSAQYAMLTLNEMMHSLRHRKIQHAIFFADGTKAFDLTKQAQILRAIDEQVQDIPLRQALKAMVVNTRLSTFRQNEQMTSYSTEGVPQGSPLGPVLFVLAYEELQKDLDRNLGIPESMCKIVPIWLPNLDCYEWGSVHLHRILFVDDHTEILEFRSKKELQSKITELLQKKEKWGVKDNPSKSQVLISGTTPSSKKYLRENRKINVQGQQLTITNSAKFLGTYISPDGNANAAVAYRIEQAQKAYHRLHSVWKSNTLSLRVRLHVFKTVVISTLVYSLETHELTNAQLQRLEVTQNTLLRKLLGRPAMIYHDTNLDLRESVSLHSISSKLIYMRVKLMWRMLKNATDAIAPLSACFGHNSDGQRHLMSKWTKTTVSLMRDLVDSHHADPAQPTISETIHKFGTLTDMHLKKVLTTYSAQDPSSRKRFGPPNAPVFECFYANCTSSFDTHAKRQAHMSSKHGYRDPLRQMVTVPKCMVCQKEFSTITKAKAHMHTKCQCFITEKHIQDFQIQTRLGLDAAQRPTILQILLQSRVG